MRVVDEGATFAVGDADRAFLRDRLRGHVEPREGGLSITRLVGHIRLPSGTTLAIRSPKAPAASVLAWVAFVDPTLRAVEWTDAIEDFGGTGDVASLVVLLFLRELRRAIARCGTPRSYVAARATSSNVRGRIDFERLVRTGGDLTRVPCTTWERLPISRTIRVIATAVRRIGRDQALREVDPVSLRSVAVALDAVPPLTDMRDVRHQAPLPRNELAFARALALARLVLTHNALGEVGDDSGQGYLINLEMLFEQTVATALAQAGLETRTKLNAPYWRQHSSETSKLVYGMQLDAFCPSVVPGGVVVDAKYKTKISSSNLQQMVTYCFALGAAHAALIVPSACTSDPRTIFFRDPHSARVIRIHTVELETTSTSVAGWRESGQRMVAKLCDVLGREA